MNWIDLVIIVLFLLSIASGLQNGLIAGSVELLSLLVSLFFAVLALPPVAGFMSSMGFSPNLALFLGFSVVFVGCQVVFAVATMPFTKRLKRKIKDTVFGPVNKYTGPIPSLVMTYITLSFILAAFLIFPIFSPIKNSVAHSGLGIKMAAPAVNILTPIAKEFKRND